MPVFYCKQSITSWDIQHLQVIFIFTAVDVFLCLCINGQSSELSIFQRLGEVSVLR